MMAVNKPLWTIEELAEWVDWVLHTHYRGAPNKRVSDRPTLRTIRYYTTIGLLDRPAEMRGRTAYYGMRHLMQLVAIKRLQSEGASLVEIQNQLLELSDEELAQIAQLPEKGTEMFREPAPLTYGRSRKQAQFWRDGQVVPEAPSPSEARAEPLLKVETLQSVSLDGGVCLVIASETPLDEPTVWAIRQAARPLLRILQNQGLIHSDTTSNQEDYQP